MGTGGSLRLLSPEIWGCQGGARPLRLPLRSDAASRYPGLLRFASLRICSSDSLRCACPFLAPSKPHRFGSLWPTDHVRLRFPLTFTLRFGFAHAPPPLRFSQIFPGQVSVSVHFPALRARFRLRFRFGSRFRLFLFPVHCSLFPTLSPRSSPRPISIIKLHTLPHFHR